MKVYCYDTGRTVEIDAASAEDAAREAHSTEAEDVDGEMGAYAVFLEEDGLWLRFEVTTHVEISYDSTEGDFVDDPTA